MDSHMKRREQIELGNMILKRIFIFRRENVAAT
jgi:hypothetical protein